MSDQYIPPQQPGYTPPQQPTPPTPPQPAPPQPGQAPPPQYAQPQYAQPQPQYPPPQAPYGQPQPQYGTPPPTPYGGTPLMSGPPAPKAKGNKGCLIAVVVFFVLLVGGGVALAVGINWAGNKVNDAVIGEGTGGPCPYLSNADASEALGTPSTATYYSGFFKVMNITDARVLPNEPSCVMVQDASSSGNGIPGLGRAVKYTGGDAASKYQQEMTKAKGVVVTSTSEEGISSSVSTESYFNKDVPDLGDGAFCIKSSGTLAGVVAHKGDTLVYVGLVQASDAPPGVDLGDPSNPKLTIDDTACDASVVLARKILG